MPPLPVVPPAGFGAGQHQHPGQQQHRHSISSQVADFNEARQSPAAALSGSSRNVPRQQAQQQRAQGLRILSPTTTLRPAAEGYPAEDGLRVSDTPAGLSLRPSADSIGDGEPCRNDNENSRPSGRSASSVAVATGGAARSEYPRPELCDWPPEIVTLVTTPFTNNQQHQARGIRSNNEPGELHTRGGRVKEGRPTDGVEMEMWKLGLQVGSKLDVKDTVEKWCEASVIAVEREAGRVFVTYTYWATKVC